MNEVRAGVMGAAVAVLLILALRPTEAPAMTAAVVDRETYRPVIQINAGDRQYLFSMKLVPLPGMYSQRIRVRVSESGFTTLHVAEASDVYPPVIDEGQD